MIVLSWNCRGLGSLRAVRSLTDLVRARRPKLLFLSETHLENKEAKKVRVKLGFNNCFVVEREGLGGGLMLLWAEKMEVVLASYSQGHIDVRIFRGSNGDWWRFTRFYCNAETYLSRHS